MKPLVLVLIPLLLGIRQLTGPPADALELVEREYAARLNEDPEDAVHHYDLGTVILLAGRHDEARSHLEAAERLDDPRTNGAAAYNLGSTDLEPAWADTLLPERDARLRRAIEAYKRALRANPDDQDAKWNLELSRRLLERDPPPADGGGGGGGGAGGGQGTPSPAAPQPEPGTGGGGGSAPNITRAQVENLLRSAREQELEVQRERLRKPQPPGPIRP